MNHEIHDPVLITTECGFAFGVIESITTTLTAKGETVSIDCSVYGEEFDGPFTEEEIFELDRPTAYDYSGMKKAIVAHPGYKWAIEESERRKNPPAIPEIMVDALAESIVAAAKAASIEGGAK